MIKLENISLQLLGKTILNNVSLYIKKGTTHVILGPSGAGKSTILKVITGLFQPDFGKIYIEGKEIISYKEEKTIETKRKIGVVFQGNALFDSLTVYENTAYFLKNLERYSRNEIDNKVKEALSFVNLEDACNLYPDQLSGGMKKRLAIARALAIDPQIILFDEPTTGLDPINAKAILNLIHRLKNIGTTSVIVTHILNDAVMIGDILTIINNGEIVVSGSKEKILNSTNEFVKEFFYEIYNSLPYMKHN